MANPTIERAALTRLLNTPNLTVLVVNVVIQGQVQVEAIGPGALDRVKVLLLPDSSQNLLDFAPSSWWLNSKSLFSAVDNGFLVVVTETPVTGPQAVSRTGSYIPEPMNPQTGDMLVYTGIGWDKLPAGPSGYVITSNGSGSLPTYQPPTGGGGGAVNSVTALTPLSSSGGTDPVISLSGVVAAANGGTGISSPGAVGNVLTSTGAGWASSAPATTSPATPVNSIQFNDAGSFGGSAGLTWDGSTLAVDGAIDRATAGTLTVGGATANAITVGKAGVTTTFPGPVDVNGVITASTGVVAPLQTNAQTASLTLALSDASRVVEVAVTSPSTATVTVPANGTVAFPIGTQILVMQTDTGTVSIAADVGVTIDYRSGLGLNLNGQWAVATLVKRATDTWVLFGDLV
jgi:hypothetical protein